MLNCDTCIMRVHCGKLITKCVFVNFRITRKTQFYETLFDKQLYHLFLLVHSFNGNFKKYVKSVTCMVRTSTHYDLPMFIKH